MDGDAQAVRASALLEVRALNEECRALLCEFQHDGEPAVRLEILERCAALALLAIEILGQRCSTASSAAPR